MPGSAAPALLTPRPHRIGAIAIEAAPAALHPRYFNRVPEMLSLPAVLTRVASGPVSIPVIRGPVLATLGAARLSTSPQLWHEGRISAVVTVSKCRVRHLDPYGQFVQSDRR